MKGILKKIVLPIALLLIIVISVGVILMKNSRKEKITDFHTELFGKQVYIFSPEDDPEEVNSVLKSLFYKQEANQFGEERYAVYFMPGEYDEKIEINLGFYTQIAGLGMLPTDTQIESFKCLARWLGEDSSNHNACCNFWRSVENIGFRSKTIWAVSQATDMRRVYVDGSLHLHDNYGWCSGGFLADSYITGMTDSGSQQQWLSRNCDWKIWMGENWNMVFAGIPEGKNPKGTWPVKPYTNVPDVPLMREKPFMVYDESKGYGVYVPGFREHLSGTTWMDGADYEWLKSGEKADAERDVILPIGSFYVAKPGDSAAAINKELSEGKNLLLTPGIYELTEPIKVQNADTIVLGIGLATLRNTAGNSALEVADESGIVVAGLLVDAGMNENNAANGVNVAEGSYLIQVGTADKKNEKQYPITMSDIYCRVGGGFTRKPTSVDTCMILQADDIIGDNFWIWRADHGDQVGWNKNVANQGIVVNGDNVSIYALMVEHFEKYQTIWNGNGGRIVMYQCEIPYDVPNQAEWMSHQGTVRGYASIHVDDEVTDFLASGLGIYLYNRDAVLTLHTAMEIPDRVGVRVENVCTVMLNGHPGMEHIINDCGNAVSYLGDREIIIRYENGEYKN